ncbi:hypothetical protein JBL43_11465 [Aureibaculum sp. A20]|uniref:Peptidase M56 domain-containing protein n=1 Tax=Aureibaculum flavum TaxID=2795986 RepID=A0ABS0WSD3_9FLAO|nr:M56 family metallopeptidase [Aureibaculum flavum]MBJ2174859.1 hypothetical protein [Aureibaculum flavum]
MLDYLLKSGVCLAVFYLFYKLLLEKEPIHMFKRFYLLGGLLLAFAIPLITFTTMVEVEPMIMAPINYSEVTFEPQPIFDAEVTPINYWPIILWTVYGFGVLAFGLKFLFNLFQIGFRVRKNTKQKVKQFTHVLLEHLSTPHTFFNYIFLNKQRYLQHQIPQEVFWHEETHAKQKHSFDVVVLEILQVVFWFNPLLYFIKKDIKLNHEFLADKAVLNKGVSLTAYQEILLAFSSNSTEPVLANALNYSSIKKRFTIMKTKTSQKKAWFKSLVLLPLVAVLVYSFSREKIIEVEASNETVQINLEDENEFQENYKSSTIEGATDRMMEEYSEFMSSFEKSKMVYGNLYKRAVAIYDLMSDAQKASVKKYPNFGVMNHKMSETKPRKPTEAEFNSWKDKSKFAIWIDGKYVDNSVLSNYTKSDIVYFSGSFVYKNARSKKFPQTQQYSLYTKTGFEEAYEKADYKKYMNLLNKYNEEVEFFNKTDKTDNSELLILKQQADFIYNSFNEEELTKYNPPKSQEVPKALISTNNAAKVNVVPNIYISISNNKEIVINGNNPIALKTITPAIEEILKEYTPNQVSKIKVIIKTDAITNMGCVLNVKNKLHEAGIRGRIINSSSVEMQVRDKATPQEIAEYNKLAKEYNAVPTDKMIVKEKDLERINYIYNKMTNIQKEEAETFPDWKFPPPLSNNQSQDTTSNNKLARLVSKYNMLKAQQNASKNSADSNNLTEQLKALEKSINEHLSNVTKNSYLATPQELTEYNKLAKHYNNMSKQNMNIKLKDVERLQFIYNKMTQEQKNGAESFPDLPPPPPAPPTPRKVIKNDTQYGYDIPPPPPPVPSQKTINKGSIELQKAFKEFSEKSKIYGTSVQNYRTTKEGMRNVEDEYKKVMELYERYEKIAIEEGISPTPPPPPPTPPNPIDHIVELAKQNALFYYEDKKITSDKAIELIKESKRIHMHVLSEGSSKPIVKLSKKPITVKN